MRLLSSFVAVFVFVCDTSSLAESISHGTTTINMDFVTVGDPGNANDTHGENYGAVDYAYRIGKYEVSVNQWEAVVAADSNDLLDDAGRWSGDQPVTHISWHETAMFCNWLTSGDVSKGAYAIDGIGVVTEIDRDSAGSMYDTVYFLPTENEWYKAAYFDGGTSTYYDFPTGSDARPDGIDFEGDTQFDDVFSDGYSQDHPNDVYNTGVLSPYGTMAQGANVAEWTESVIGGTSRVTRGTIWDGSWVHLQASSSRLGFFPSYEYRDLGFRVASSSTIPEPGSLAMLAGLTLTGLLYWHRRRKT